MLAGGRGLREAGGWRGSGRGGREGGAGEEGSAGGVKKGIAAGSRGEQRRGRGGQGVGRVAGGELCQVRCRNLDAPAAWRFELQRIARRRSGEIPSAGCVRGVPRGAAYRFGERSVRNSSCYSCCRVGK